MHEVLGPIAYCLPEENLLPGYLTCIPNENTDIPSPRYNVFYTLIEKIDNEFMGRRNAAWTKSLCFFRKLYLNSAPYLKNHDELSESAVIVSAIEEYKKSSTEEVAFYFPMLKFYIEIIASMKEKKSIWVFVEDLLELCEATSLKQLMAKRLEFASADSFFSYALFSRGFFPSENKFPIVQNDGVVNTVRNSPR